MTIARAFCLGLLSAAVFVLASLLATSLPLLSLFVLTQLALGVAAVFTPIVGWPRRAVRGVLGFVVAALAVLATFIYLQRTTDWFDWPDEHGADMGALIIISFAAGPGGVAASAASPSCGLALAGGFTLGLSVAAALAGPENPGMMILLAVGTLTGAGVNALGNRRRS